jgi:hypothetical protein
MQFKGKFGHWGVGRGKKENETSWVRIKGEGKNNSWAGEANSG